MKNLFFFCFLFVTTPILPGVALAAPIALGDNGGANGNLHNMSFSATHSGIKALAPASGGTTQVCIFCHTPHAASAQSTLWGRPDPQTMGSYPLYGQLTEVLIDNIPAAQYSTTDYPNGATKLCLSCHDGVTSIGTLLDGTVISMPVGQTTISDPTKYFLGSGMDFSKTHPVSFVYSQAVQTTINTNPDPNKNGKYSWPNAANRNLLDTWFRVQCTTCHDPHLDTGITDGTRDPATGSYDLPFWRKFTGVEATDYNAVCVQCHVGGSGGTIRQPTIPNTHNIFP